MNLGIVDRVGGITFGAAKAGVLLSAVVWAFAMVPEDMRGTWQQDSKLYPTVEIFANNIVKVFALEDEMAIMQSTVGSIMGSGKNKLMEQTLGGGTGGSTPDLMKLLGGSEGEDQTEVLSRAMESMGGSQKGMLEQAMQAMGVGGGGDSSNLDLFEQLQTAVDAGPNRQAEMDKLLDEMEAEAQGRKK
jgi:hypothetical protein